jgi:hypothetical protein
MVSFHMEAPATAPIPIPVLDGDDVNARFQILDEDGEALIEFEVEPRYNG